MGLSNAKKRFLCLTLLCMVLLMRINCDDDIDDHLNPCKGSNVAYGCRKNLKNLKEPPQAANPWNRGCSPINRCRGG
ncbi:hypothetical protein PVL29_009309 [Vitis rotundifolia]|uniref:Uncharacterized protein n=1 Tax=Vitis rotundifolia TaxID=103349 RepID=A0AA38ZYU1_VITRO|nr:hypothetical protein PVL29_009309 [Vitis rotundifolia]